MPSRWAKTGTRASACTRATRLLPPRGTITSIVAVEAGEHRAHRGAVGRRHDLDRVRGQAGGGEALAAGQSTDGARRRRGSPSRRAGCTALPALRHSAPASAVDVGAALVDHADDAERRRHALDVQAVRPVPRGDHAADGVGQRRRSPRTPRRDGLEPGGVERQPVEEGSPWCRAPPPPRRRGHWRRGWRGAAARMAAAPARSAAFLARGAARRRAARAAARAAPAHAPASGRGDIASPSVIACQSHRRRRPSFRSRSAMSSRWTIAARPA